MDILEKGCLEFVKNFNRAYFEQRDIPAVVESLDQDISWTGTGQTGICYGLEAVREMLCTEDRMACYLIAEDQYRVCMLGEGVYGVEGRLKVRERISDLELLELEVRASIICRWKQERFYIKQIHLSVPEAEQSPHMLPRHFENQDAQTLRILVQKQSEELRVQSQDIQALMDNIPGGVMCCDCTTELNLLEYSQGFLRMTGYTREELEQKFHNHFSKLIYPEDLEATWAQVHRQLQKGTTKQIEYRIRHKDGRLIDILDHGQLVYRDSGDSVFYCILTDITDSKRAQEELRLSLERHQIIMDQSQDIIFEWDIAKDTLMFSANWEKKFGYAPITENISKDIPKKSHIHPNDIPVFVEIMESTAAGCPYSETEFRILKGDGAYIWCKIRATLQKNNADQPAKAVGVIMDIDAQKRQEQKMQQQAQRDGLTGLYNKSTVRFMVEQYLANMNAHEKSAFLIIDVDNFKAVNDIYGHLGGDVMLSDIAGILQELFSDGDYIGRIGGDEFLVVLCDTGDFSSIEENAKRVLEAFGAMFSDEHVSCSIGIALVPEHGRDYITLYKNADIALYQAKTKGKNTYAVYSPDTPRLSFLGLDQSSKIGQKIDSEKETSVLNNKLAEYVFHVLYQSVDIETVIPQIMEIIGRQFDVSRVYIFEDSEDGRYCKNTFEWCNKGIEPQIDALQHFEYDQADYYYDNFDEDGIFYCRDIKLLSPGTKETLQPQGIKSVLQCTIQDNGKNCGFVGFDDCRKNRIWTQAQINSLTMVAEMVSIFLLKKRAQIRIAQTMKSLEMILDHQENGIYVIQKGSFELLYINRRIKSIVPKIQKQIPCYRAFFKSEAVCKHCPVKKLEAGDTQADSFIYDKRLKKNIMTKATAIPWAGEAEAYLVSCSLIEEGQCER